jgi:serine/threonine protein kinase
VLGEGTFACVWRTSKRNEAGRKLAIKQVQVHPLEKDMAYR